MRSRIVSNFEMCRHVKEAADLTDSLLCFLNRARGETREDSLFAMQINALIVKRTKRQRAEEPHE